MKLNQFAFAVMFAIGPMTGALAQGTLGPAIGADNHNENQVKEGSATDTTANSIQGDSGKTVVAGPKSTTGTDQGAASETKTGSSGSAGK